MPRTLLLADDSITIQKVVGITFAAEDFTVVTVDNGEDAFARARELRPAIVIADVAMPRRNGYELSQAIKSDPELRGIPVLLLAGTFEPLDPAKAAAAQANGHLVKPFDTQALIDKVGELLGGAPAAAGAVPLPAPGAQVPAARPAVAAWPTGSPTRPQPMGQPLAQPAGVPPQRPVPLSQPQVRPPTSPFGIPASAPAVPGTRPTAPMPVAPASAPPPGIPRAPLPLTSPFPPVPSAAPSAAPSAFPMRPAAAAPVPAFPAPVAPRPPSPFMPPQVAAPPAAPRPPSPFAPPQANPAPGSAVPLRVPTVPSPARVPVPFPAAGQPGPTAVPQAAPSPWGAPQPRPTQPLPLQPSAPVAFAPPPAARVPIPAPIPLPAPVPPAAARAAVPTPAWTEVAPPPASFAPEPFGIPGFDEQTAPEISGISGMAEAAAAASVQSSPADLSLDVPMEEEPPELLPEIDGFELGSSQDLDVSMTGGSAGAFISGELSDFSQQGGLAPSEHGGLDFDGGGDAEQPLELASAHEFLDSAADPFMAPEPVTAPVPAARAVMPVPAAPARIPIPAAAGAPAALSASPQADGEATLRLALSQASREVIERVVWEVVPQLAEIILREHVERMERERLQQ